MVKYIMKEGRDKSSIPEISYYMKMYFNNILEKLLAHSPPKIFYVHNILHISI